MMRKAAKKRLEKLLENMPEGYAYQAGYLRVDKEYPINVVLSNIGDEIIVVDGHPVKMWSMRYKTFTKGTSCVICGREGRYFRLEKNALHADTEGNSWHFNLYSIEHNGDEILMTKDHVIPRSKGGRSKVSNMQTLCYRCNTKKGNGHKMKEWNLERYCHECAEVLLFGIDGRCPMCDKPITVRPSNYLYNMAIKEGPNG